MKRISTPAIELLMGYHWPGNVRELENCMARAVLVCEGGVIHAHDLPPSLQTAEVSGTMPRLSLGERGRRTSARGLIRSVGSRRPEATAPQAARLLDTTERIIGYKIQQVPASTAQGSRRSQGRAHPAAEPV